MKAKMTKKVLQLIGLYSLQSSKRFDYAPPGAGNETHIQLHFAEYQYVGRRYWATGHSWECIVTVKELFDALGEYITENAEEGQL